MKVLEVWTCLDITIKSTTFRERSLKIVAFDTGMSRSESLADTKTNDSERRKENDALTMESDEDEY